MFVKDCLKMSARALFGALSMGLVVSACADIEPGDYLVYRVAFEQAQQAASCFPGGQVPVDQQNDTSTNFTPDTWILYMGPEDRVYLDIGVTTLGGKEEGDGYAFNGKRVDVQIQDDGMGGEITTTTTTTTNITFNIEGEVVDGSIEDRTRMSCNGSMSCPEATDCTTTRNFVGGEVDDVELQHDV
jgi:hypothetical protein